MATKVKKAEVSLPAEGQVEVTRTFDAPRALVYEAYTRPELMRKWLLGPPGWTMPVCEMDPRPGGTFRWRWRSEEDGQEFGFEGEFLEVEAPALIRHTEVYDPGDFGGSAGGGGVEIPESMGDGEAIVTLRFTEEDGATTVSTLIDYGTDESRDEAMSTGMTDGMELSYQNLDRLLAERR